MNCDHARKIMTLFVHGELNFDEEENLSQHVSQCTECARELSLERAIVDLAEAARLEPTIGQLSAARRQFAARLVLEKTTWRSQIREWFDFHPGLRFAMMPVAGICIALAGFYTGSAVHKAESDWGPVAQRVRFVEPSASGQVALVIDETRQKKIYGAVEDSRIRSLLLTAAKDPDDPGLRAEVVDALKGRTEAADFRAVLLTALEKDTNPEVRMKALEVLRPYAKYADVRRAVSNVLLHDSSPDVRTMAIDMIVPIDQPDVAGTLQQLLEKGESNQYLRQRSQSALIAMKASTNTF